MHRGNNAAIWVLKYKIWSLKSKLQSYHVLKYYYLKYNKIEKLWINKNSMPIEYVNNV